MLVDEHPTAAQPRCCPLRAGATQTSLTSTRSCSVAYSRCWDGLPQKAFWQTWGPLGKSQGDGVRPQGWVYFPSPPALPWDPRCPRTCRFNDSIPVPGVGRKRWGLCKKINYILHQVTSRVNNTASPAFYPALYPCPENLFPPFFTACSAQSPVVRGWWHP